jgi:peroxiredoxin/uncharacterized membrane protein YphA (DoxX/SURF4 family)
MMSGFEPGALVVARLLLAGVFLFAGVGKLADRAGTRDALTGFGAPARAAQPLALALPLVELAVAISLLFRGGVWAGAVGALLLLGAFAVAIGVNLARGRRPDCHCFGNLHSEPIGPSTLGFNAALAVVAGLLAWRSWDDPGPSLFSWIGELTGAERASLVLGVITIALVAALVVLMWQMLGQQGRLLLRMDALEARLEARKAAAQRRGLTPGANAPDFALRSLDGELVTLRTLEASGLPVLLVFTHPHCGPCQNLLPDIAHWRRSHAAPFTVALVSEGSAEDNQAAQRASAGPVLLQRGREVADAYEAWGTPSAVLVADGRIASALASGRDAIRRLVEFQTPSQDHSASVAATLA